MTEEDAGTRIAFDTGDCLMTTGSGVLELAARAVDDGALAQVEDVVGRHLEKFGTRAGLSVDWAPGPPD